MIESNYEFTKQTRYTRFQRRRKLFFTPTMIVQIAQEADRQKLIDRITYYVKTGLLKNPRKGTYVKGGYSR
jgi:hypothetical protein